MIIPLLSSLFANLEKNSFEKIVDSDILKRFVVSGLSTSCGYRSDINSGLPAKEPAEKTPAGVAEGVPTSNTADGAGGTSSVSVSPAPNSSMPPTKANTPVDQFSIELLEIELLKVSFLCVVVMQEHANAGCL